MIERKYFRADSVRPNQWTKGKSHGRSGRSETSRPLVQMGEPESHGQIHEGCACRITNYQEWIIDDDDNSDTVMTRQEDKRHLEI